MQIFVKGEKGMRAGQYNKDSTNQCRLQEIVRRGRGASSLPNGFQRNVPTGSEGISNGIGGVKADLPVV